MELVETKYAHILFDSQNNLYSINVGAHTADIRAVIASAADGATIEFSAGTHVLSETLYIQRDNITVRGMGEGQTTLVVAAASGDGIVFKGSMSSLVSPLQESVSTGSRYITIENAQDFEVGDVLMISQPNDEKFLSSGIYDNVIDSSYMKDCPLRETIAEIESIQGNIIILKQEIAYDMEAGAAKVQKINVLKDVGLSDMTVTYDLGIPDPDNFSNTLSQFNGSNAVAFLNTQNAEISNIAIKNAASIGLELRNALEAHVDGLVVEGAHNKGEEGNGYGLHIAGSFYGTYENLNLIDVRHAVVFSSWNAEVHNNVHVLYTNRDINYHGSDDYANTVIVDQNYYEGSDLNNWALVSPGSFIHPYTDISKNTTLFGYAVGSIKDDTVFGRDDGAQLYGEAGNDFLTGGAGDDIISGDTGNDVMAGGQGSDIFLFDANDGDDVIADFRVGLGGDILILNGYAGLSNLNDLVVSQNGLDTQIILSRYTGQSDTITLKNVQWSNVTQDNIVIQAAPSKAMDVTLSALQDIVRTGDGSNDIVRTSFSKLSAEDVINLGGGQDTLQIATSSFTMDTSLYTRLTGVDVIDLTLATAAKIVMNQSMIDASDNGRITLLYAENGIARLASAGLSAESSVYLQGNGAVTLADNLNNTVHVNAATTGEVNGLRGADTFIIGSQTSAILNGGGGNDSFDFRGDFLTAQAVINGGDGIDTLRFVSAVNLSADDLENISGIERFEFLRNGSTLTLGRNVTGLYGSDSAVSIKADISALTSSTTLTLGHNANVSIIGVTSQSLTFVLEDSTARLIGGDASETIIGSAGKDKFSGGGGADLLIGGLNNDILTGGNGKDTFQITLGDGKDTITDFQTGASGDILRLTGYYHLSSLSNVNLVQEYTDVRLILNAKENILFKNKVVSDFSAENFIFDNNVVINVVLKPTVNADRLISGSGNDLLNAYTSTLGANDIIDLGGGIDTLKFMSAKTAFDFTAMAKATGVEVIDLTSTITTRLCISQELGAGSVTGNLTIKYGEAGFAGLDTSRVSSANDVVLQGGGHATLSLADGVNNRVVLDVADDIVLRGGSGSDTIRLRGGSAEVQGQAGNDTVMVVGEGTWNLNGGEGNDVFTFTRTAYLKNQSVQGGAGFDDLRLYENLNLDANELMGVSGIERIVFYGSSNNLELTSSLFDSRLELKGNSGNLSLSVDMAGMSGDKTLVIADNLSVTLYGQSGASYRIETTSRTNGSVTGSGGNDTIIGNDASDVLYGNDGSDVLIGATGNDILSGGRGHDTLNGGRGADTLYGGDGDDIFQFASSNEFGDTIKDFRHDNILEKDILDLTALFDSNNLGHLDAQAALNSGYLSLQQSGLNTNVVFDRDGYASRYAAMTVTTLENVQAVSLPHDAIVV